MQQRLGIAQTVMDAPNVLILDEPTNGLDTKGVDWFRGMLRKKRGRMCRWPAIPGKIFEKNLKNLEIHAKTLLFCVLIFIEEPSVHKALLLLLMTRRCYAKYDEHTEKRSFR